MSDPFGDKPFPKQVLFAAAGLVGLSFVFAAGGRLTDFGTTKTPSSSPIESRDFVFEDRRDGGVNVLAAKSKRLIAEVAPGKGGFVRGVLRGFARDRRSHAIGAGPPFRLTRWADGRLSLQDVATGRRVELDPFGPTNAGAFAKMLIAARTIPAQTKPAPEGTLNRSPQPKSTKAARN